MTARTPYVRVPAPNGSSGTTRHRIAVIPGDGIGGEVVAAAVTVLDAAGADAGVEFEWTEFDWNCARYARTGAMMPADGLDRLAGFDAIFLGAVGWPTVPDHVSLWGLLIPIRRHFRQYVNLRPVQLLPGIVSPLAGVGPADVDFVIVRENNEGEYSQVGGRLHGGTDEELAVQESIFTARGVDRVLRYAFELAREHGSRHVTSATKSNGIVHTMPFWDERFARMAERYPDVRTDEYHIDALSAYLVQRPAYFDVIVGSNLFGDILSDLGAAVAGSIGIAPAANINPEREYPSMFEPVHGSAPDIAGQGVANPIGQIWTGAMMLDHLGHPDPAAAVRAALGRVLTDPDPATRTPDLGGVATTSEVTQAVVAALATPAAAPTALAGPPPPAGATGPDRGD
ncbi:tartrate dehydrogenase [Micromonospora sp. WMMD1082]|uniref:tartrate dehydrogenase n=1 Tax=Micromonospora sp. WMMD1082 TaxID=3016104 RepID=UPI002416D102|nr:tartrate dehydrogenase [Micromonospora sp. WMMD1082]MDG4798366.1 tartrate dehydrogenase [Micromonospora sp. WMMD1082]